MKKPITNKECVGNLVVIFFVILFFPAYVFAQSANSDLENIKNASPALVRAYEKIKIFDTWNEINKLNIPFATTTVAVIDSGVDSLHPEFLGINFGDSDPEALIDNAPELFNKPDGHGTGVAGIIGANNLFVV